ncbi:tyrosine-type recombinase/integrase [Photobacterium sp.]|uniref:tyrosine-type recombinase/integrase n=1 Tax=Photobacterium sp. TaxID=660 RepID=UPI00299F3433|nr:tyrosine-type recombinase/integrase [Photobacterium sp.]MDX1302808.1 tyrosine-type recombinase/integrase [Photobacterium sp.]
MAKNIPAIKNNEQRKISQSAFSEIMDGLDFWQSLTHRCYAKNTLLAFKNDWNTFVAYCQANKASALPTTVQTVHNFIELMSKTRKLASLKRYIVTIGLVHRCHALPDPCSHTEVKLAMRKQRLEKHDDYRHAKGFRDNHLQQLIALLDFSPKVKDIRDIAIWAVAFEAMLKRSELADLTVDKLEVEKNGLINIIIDERIISLSNVASKALQRWLVVGIIDTGFVFRRIDRHSNIGDKPLDHSSIYRVFRRASEELGLPAKVIFSGQSPRVGAVKDLADSGLSISEIQTQGRWKSPVMPAQYVGNTEKRDQEIAKFVKEKPWEH